MMNWPDVNILMKSMSKWLHTMSVVLFLCAVSLTKWTLSKTTSKMIPTERWMSRRTARKRLSFHLTLSRYSFSTGKMLSNVGVVNFINFVLVLSFTFTFTFIFIFTFVASMKKKWVKKKTASALEESRKNFAGDQRIQHKIKIKNFLSYFSSCTFICTENGSHQ